MFNADKVDKETGKFKISAVESKKKAAYNLSQIVWYYSVKSNEVELANDNFF